MKGSSRTVSICTTTASLRGQTISSVGIFVHCQGTNFHPQGTRTRMHQVVRISRRLALQTSDLVGSIRAVSPRCGRTLLGLHRSVVSLTVRVCGRGLFLRECCTAGPSLQKGLLEE